MSIKKIEAKISLAKSNFHRLGISTEIINSNMVTGTPN
uniref:Uncharacterized protein n=1 Tax=Arundo donax TaxID=35708 RepID=A0A0A8Z4T2_ARUDO